MQALSGSVSGGVAKRAPKCIGHIWRNGINPACISLATARAWARALRSRGQIARSGNASARYSMIARLSQTDISPSIRAGTLPDGENSRTRPRLSGTLNGMTISSNGISKAASTIQGRNDQDE